MGNSAGYKKEYYARPEVRERVLAQQRERWKRPEVKAARTRTNRDYKLRTRFGITLVKYEQMNVEQAGLCAICLQSDDGRDLAVDHDHETGEVRGLLCSNCNRALGQFKDDIDNLRRAVAYLEKTA